MLSFAMRLLMLFLLPDARLTQNRILPLKISTQRPNYPLTSTMTSSRSTCLHEKSLFQIPTDQHHSPYIFIQKAYRNIGRNSAAVSPRLRWWRKVYFPSSAPSATLRNFSIRNTKPRRLDTKSSCSGFRFAWSWMERASQVRFWNRPRKCVVMSLTAQRNLSSAEMCNPLAEPTGMGGKCSSSAYIPLSCSHIIFPMSYNLPCNLNLFSRCIWNISFSHFSSSKSPRAKPQNAFLISVHAVTLHCPLLELL